MIYSTPLSPVISSLNRSSENICSTSSESSSSPADTRTPSSEAISSPDDGLATLHSSGLFQATPLSGMTQSLNDHITEDQKHIGQSNQKLLNRLAEKNKKYQACLLKSETVLREAGFTPELIQRLK